MGMPSPDSAVGRKLDLALSLDEWDSFAPILLHVGTGLLRLLLAA